MDLVDEMLNVLKNLSTFESAAMAERTLKMASWFLADLLMYEAAQFKAKAFEEEREWRAIYASTAINRLSRNKEMEKYLQFRMAGSEIIPYMELDIAPSAQKSIWFLPIDEIIVGAKINLLKAQRSIVLLCKQIGCEMPLIKPSSITLQ